MLINKFKQSKGTKIEVKHEIVHSKYSNNIILS